MAIIRGGSPMGEIRGKLGASVYSRNKAGQIVRAYAVPVNPNTLAQQAARMNFAQAVSGFHTLSPTLKAGWNSFGSSYFTSKRLGNVPGVHSGVNAFISLRNNLLNMERMKNAVGDMEVRVNTVAATALTQGTIVLGTTAPTTVMQGVLASGDYVINNAETTVTAGLITMVINVTGTGSGPSPVPPAPQTTSILTDGNGHPVGFNVYASNPLIQRGIFVNNPDVTLLGSTGIIDSYTSASVTTTSLEIDMLIMASQSEHKIDFLGGSLYEISIWMVNDAGQSIKIGSNITTIT